MRAVVQRVSSASVTIDGTVTASIQRGLLILLGVQVGDTAEEARWLARKISALRIFADQEGRMNLSLQDFIAPPSSGDAALQALVVSQFTLIATTDKGSRPSFNHAAKPPEAIPLYEGFVRALEEALGLRVPTGTFGADMKVALVNDGPVTLILDSRNSLAVIDG